MKLGAELQSMKMGELNKWALLELTLPMRRARAENSTS